MTTLYRLLPNHPDLSKPHGLNFNNLTCLSLILTGTCDFSNHAFTQVIPQYKTYCVI